MFCPNATIQKHSCVTGLVTILGLFKIKNLIINKLFTAIYKYTNNITNRYTSIIVTIEQHFQPRDNF